MAKQARDELDPSDKVAQGLDTLIQAGRVGEVEQLLSTLLDDESGEELTDEEREMHTYARGLRDGLALARGADGG